MKLADSKLADVHTPIKKVVNLQAQTTQQFDVMGFVTKVEELKTIGTGRRVCEIVIEDGRKIWKSALR